MLKNPQNQTAILSIGVLPAFLNMQAFFPTPATSSEAVPPQLVSLKKHFCSSPLVISRLLPARPGPAEARKKLRRKEEARRDEARKKSSSSSRATRTWGCFAVLVVWLDLASRHAAVVVGDEAALT